MDKIIKAMKNCKLFDGLEEKELKTFIEVIGPKTKEFEKNEYIFRAGDFTLDAGLVVEGMVHIVHEDYWGNRTIISEIWPGEIFAETYACARDECFTVNVIAAESTQIFFIDMACLLSSQDIGQVICGKLTGNLLKVFADKNLLLSRKIGYMCQKTIRSKLMAYLSSQSVKVGTDSFEIPFNRQQLADYLSVDRSALSKGLCDLRDEGILTFEKNKFKLRKG